MSDAYQVLADCPHCRTEAAVVELMDPRHPACHFGLPAESRCRMCGWATKAADEPFAARLPLGSGRCPACNARIGEHALACAGCGYAPRVEEVAPPMDLTGSDAALTALARWAAEEGEADAAAFCLANVGRSVDEVVGLLATRSPVPTSFDVIAYLFPQQSGRGSVAPDPRSPAIDVVDRPPSPPPVPTSPSPEAPMDPRTPARVLVSVMVADGELRPGEIRFVTAWLAQQGLPAFTQADLRLWRPHELGGIPPEPLRDRLLEACVQLAHLDRERDGSEWRVIHTYARAWGVPDERVAAWDKAFDKRYATAMTRLWQALSGMVRLH